MYLITYSRSPYERIRLDRVSFRSGWLWGCARQAKCWSLASQHQISRRQGTSAPSLNGGGPFSIPEEIDSAVRTHIDILRIRGPALRVCLYASYT